MTEDLVGEYSRQVRVPIYDVGPQHLLKPGCILRLVQETSEQHLDLLHVSYEELRRQKGLVFFIITSRVKISRLPTHNELLTIRTHPRGRSGVQFYRDFKFYDEAGNLIIDVMQTTVLADIETRKVQRPKSLYEISPFQDFPVEPSERMERITLKGDFPLAGIRNIYYSDLDSNGHVNNSVYGDIVEDFLPAERQGQTIREMQITYLGESSLGDELRVYSDERDGRVLMKGVHARGDSFTAAVRF